MTYSVRQCSNIRPWRQGSVIRRAFRRPTPRTSQHAARAAHGHTRTPCATFTAEMGVDAISLLIRMACGEVCGGPHRRGWKVVKDSRKRLFDGRGIQRLVPQFLTGMRDVPELARVVRDAVVDAETQVIGVEAAGDELRAIPF
jgi:hypothetical protein